MPFIQQGQPIKEGHIIYTHFMGAITQEDVELHEAYITTQVEQTTFPVDIIINIDSNAKLNMSISEIRNSTGGGNPKIRWTILIVKNQFIQFMGNVISQVSGRQYRFRAFTTREAAIAFLKDIDPSLHDLVLPPTQQKQPAE